LARPGGGDRVATGHSPRHLRMEDITSIALLVSTWQQTVLPGCKHILAA
jgi:hypothetical protein